MNILNFSDVLSNKMAAMMRQIPIDNRRSDGMPNPKLVAALQYMINLVLTRLQRDYGDLEKIKGAKVISFCLRSDPDREDTSDGWRGVFKRFCPDSTKSINSLVKVLKILEAMGCFVWESQGRHRAGLLHCDVEALLLADQVCMALLTPNMEPEQGQLQGDEQLSAEYWAEQPKKPNALRSTLRWVGKVANRVFQGFPRRLDLPAMIDEAAIALWDELHRIIVPVVKTWKIETEIDFSWVNDRWLELGDPYYA